MNYHPGDEVVEGYVSNCCGANVIYGDICSECKEHCDLTKLEDTVQLEAQIEREMERVNEY